MRFLSCVSYASVIESINFFKDGKPRLQSKLVSPPNIVNDIFENCSDPADSESLCLLWGNTLKLNVAKEDDICVTVNWILLVSSRFIFDLKIFLFIK